MHPRKVAIGFAVLVVLMPISGCLQNTRISEPTPIIEIEGVFVTGPDGLPVDSEPLDLIFNLSDVGEDGAEPSIGVTSSGCIFSS